MKAKDLHPGDLVAYDQRDETGRRIALVVEGVELDDIKQQTTVTFTNSMNQTFHHNETMSMYEELHPNAVNVLEAAYRELTALLDGDVDAPNVWRWTVMRLRNRVAEVTPRHRLREIDVPVFLNVAAPAGNERPNEHWNARLIREQAEGSSQQAR